MPVNLSMFPIYVCIFLPVLVFGVAWRGRYQQASKTLAFPTLSAVLLAAAAVRSLKVSLLGSDHSDRLYITIGANMLLAVAAAIYFCGTKKWIPALAALILALDWLYLGIVNSVV
jgi:uncharacterized membrane protein (UPF0136 family)